MSVFPLGSSMHFVSTIFTTIGYGGVTPATLGISLHLDRNQQKMNRSTLYISSYRQYFQGASSWPSWWSSLSFPSSFIASALQHLTSTIWSTGLPKTHHSLPSLCETISNRDTDVLLLLLHRILNTIFNLSPEPWALQSITMTLKTSPQKNQMSMKSCERKPFGR